MTITDFDHTQPHAICGTNALGARIGVGCGEPVFFDRPFIDDQHIAIRCADCMAVFCVPCARKHFDSSKRNFIELAMRHETAKLALAPFADYADACDKANGGPILPHHFALVRPRLQTSGVEIGFEHFFAARAALMKRGNE